MGFTQTKLLIELDLVSGVNFDLQEYLYFDSKLFGNLRTKTSSDGISAPQAVQNIIQRFGPYVASGIMHDGGFRNRLEVQSMDGTWEPLVLDESQCNALIDECLRSEKCSWLEREIIYHMLGLFGWVAFESDRKDDGNKPTTADIQKLIKPS